MGWLLGERRDGFDGEQFTAGLAGLLLLPFHSGGRFGHGDPISGGVTESRNYGLCNQNFTAGSAMLALGQTRFGAGGSHGGVGDLGVGMLGCGAYALGENHLTVRVKGVASHGNGRAVGEGHAAHVGGAQVQGNASGDLITVVDEVVIPFKLNQLVTGLFHVLDVEEIADDTVLHFGDHHFTLGIKLIGARGDGTTVGEGHAAHIGLTQIQALFLCDLVPVIDEVEVSLLILHEPIGLLPDTVDVEIIVMGAAKQGGNAIRAAMIVDGFVGGEKTHKARLHIAGSVEEVGLSVDLVRLGGGSFGRGIPIVAGAVPIAGARRGGDPDAACEPSVFKEEHDTVVGVLVAIQSRVGGLIKVIPLISRIMPAAQQLSVYRIIVFAIDGLDTRFGKGTAAVTHDPLAGYIHRIGMTSGRNLPSFFQYGTAIDTKNSARITGLGGRWRLIRCFPRRVLMGIIRC